MFSVCCCHNFHCFRIIIKETLLVPFFLYFTSNVGAGQRGKERKNEPSSSSPSQSFKTMPPCPSSSRHPSPSAAPGAPTPPSRCNRGSSPAGRPRKPRQRGTPNEASDSRSGCSVFLREEEAGEERVEVDLEEEVEVETKESSPSSSSSVSPP